MKRSISWLALLFTLLLTVAGCKNDPCKGLICDNGATCLEGDCICEPGYEGRFCSDETRTKYLGTFNASQDCNGDVSTFECVINRSSPNVVRIIFSNFANIESEGIIPDVYAEMNEDGSINIPTQEVQGNTFSGSGNIDDNGLITLTYTRTNTQGSTTCTATFTAG